MREPFIEFDNFDHLEFLIVDRRVVEEIVEIRLRSVEYRREDHLLFQRR